MTPWLSFAEAGPASAGSGDQSGEDFSFNLTKLRQVIVQMEKAVSDKDDGLLEQVGGTAELAENATGGMKASKQLLTLVSNTYVGAVGTLAEWKTVSHIVWPQGGGDVSPAAPAVVN